MDAARFFVQSGKVFLESTMPQKAVDYLMKLGHDVAVVDREFGFALPTGIKNRLENGNLAWRSEWITCSGSWSLILSLNY
jgi:hypothetical protein